MQNKQEDIRVSPDITKQSARAPSLSLVAKQYRCYDASILFIGSTLCNCAKSLSTWIIINQAWKDGLRVMQAVVGGKEKRSPLSPGQVDGSVAKSWRQATDRRRMRRRGERSDRSHHVSGVQSRLFVRLRFRQTV